MAQHLLHPAEIHLVQLSEEHSCGVPGGHCRRPPQPLQLETSTPPAAQYRKSTEEHACPSALAQAFMTQVFGPQPQMIAVCLIA